MTPISVVIPTLGNIESLRRVLASICESVTGQDISVQVLVVYSGSRPKGLASHVPEVTLELIYSSASGVNHKRNLGLVYSKSPITFFLDDDCEVLSSNFFHQHLSLHHSHPRALIVGGTYINTSYGLWSGAYSRVQEGWSKKCLSQGGEPFLGGNLSMKTAAGYPWLRFNESISFGGTEAELISWTQRNFEGSTIFDSKISVGHHVSLNMKDFVKKAFLQGRAQGVRTEQGLNPQEELFEAKNPIYKFVFESGQIFGQSFGYQSPSLLVILQILIFQLFGLFPKFYPGDLVQVPVMRTSVAGQVFQKAMSTWKLLFWKLMFPIWIEVKVKIFWQTFYRGARAAGGGFQKLRAFLEIYLFWKGLYRFWNWAKVAFYWNGIFRLWNLLAPRALSVYLFFERHLYWRGAFRFWWWIKGNIWRIPFFSVMLYRIIHFKLPAFLKKFFYPMWIWIKVAFYWNGIFRLWHFLAPRVLGVYLFFERHLYWQGVFRLWCWIRGNIWKIPFFSVILYKICNLNSGPNFRPLPESIWLRPMWAVCLIGGIGFRHLQSLFGAISRFYLFLEKHLFWQGLFVVASTIRGNLWKIPYLRVVLAKAYHAFVWPVLLALLKPYHFCRYQLDKRF